MFKRSTPPDLGDLFQLFPDLPWRRPRRSRAEQLAHVRRMVALTRARALGNISRQKRTIAHMRVQVAEHARQLRLKIR